MPLVGLIYEVTDVFWNYFRLYRPYSSALAQKLFWRSVLCSKFSKGVENSNILL